METLTIEVKVDLVKDEWVQGSLPWLVKLLQDSLTSPLKERLSESGRLRLCFESDDVDLVLAGVDCGTSNGDLQFVPHDLPEHHKLSKAAKQLLERIAEEWCKFRNARLEAETCPAEVSLQLDHNA